jgi:hypothetical protein
MAKPTYTIPNPPVFPASNASYNSIVSKMHDVATKAEPEGVIKVVTLLADTIGGVNTYAKAVRRYADDIKAAIINFQPKYYKTLSAAKTAVTKAGLDVVACTFIEEKGGYLPMFIATGETRSKAIAAGFTTAVEGN